MDFDEYWRNGCFGEYHDIYAKNLAEQFYNAGQQSKQAEIDALKAKLDENHRLIHIDDLRTLVHWTEMMASEYGDDDAVEIALRVKSMIEDQK